METSWYRIEVSSADGWRLYGRWGNAYQGIRSYDLAVDTINHLRDFHKGGPARFRLIHCWIEEAVIPDV